MTLSNRKPLSNRHPSTALQLASHILPRLNLLENREIGAWRQSIQSREVGLSLSSASVDWNRLGVRLVIRSTSSASLNGVLDACVQEVVQASSNLGPGQDEIYSSGNSKIARVCRFRSVSCKCPFMLTHSSAETLLIRAQSELYQMQVIIDPIEYADSPLRKGFPSQHRTDKSFHRPYLQSVPTIVSGLLVS